MTLHKYTNFLKNLQSRFQNKKIYKYIYNLFEVNVELKSNIAMDFHLIIED